MRPVQALNSSANAVDERTSRDDARPLLFSPLFLSLSDAAPPPSSTLTVSTVVAATGQRKKGMIHLCLVKFADEERLRLDLNLPEVELAAR